MMYPPHAARARVELSCSLAHSQQFRAQRYIDLPTCAWLKTVVMLKHPGHLTSMKKLTRARRERSRRVVGHRGGEGHWIAIRGIDTEERLEDDESKLSAQQLEYYPRGTAPEVWIESELYAVSCVFGCSLIAHDHPVTFQVSPVAWLGARLQESPVMDSKTHWRKLPHRCRNDRS